MGAWQTPSQSKGSTLIWMAPASLTPTHGGGKWEWGKPTQLCKGVASSLHVSAENPYLPMISLSTICPRRGWASGSTGQGYSLNKIYREAVMLQALGTWQ